MQSAIVKGAVEGIGIVLILFLAKKLDKNLISVTTVKSGLVLVSAAALANLGIEYLEEKGYLKTT